MLRIELPEAAHGRCDFGISPLFELVSLLHILGRGEAERLRPRWAEQLPQDFLTLRASVDIDLVAALQGDNHGADFLARPPDGMGQTWAEDLAAVRATPLRQARTEIARCVQLNPVSPRAARTLTRPDVMDQLATVLDQCWQQLVEPHWVQLRAAAERDVRRRRATIAAAGWPAVFSGLHSRLRYQDGQLEMTGSGGRSRLSLPESDWLVIVPSVFIWPGLTVTATHPHRRSVIYPVAGSDISAAAAAADRAEALVELIGRSRARILCRLAEPASTTALADELGLALGAVGDHLQVLRRVGLAEGTRAGRSVLYRRTALGDVLSAGPDELS